MLVDVAALTQYFRQFHSGNIARKKDRLLAHAVGLGLIAPIALEGETQGGEARSLTVRKTITINSVGRNKLFSSIDVVRVPAPHVHPSQNEVRRGRVSLGWGPSARPEAPWALRCGQANSQQRITCDPVARPQQLGCEAGSRKIAVAIYA